MRETIISEINSRMDEIFGMAEELYRRPELSGEEVFAEKLISSRLEENGFAVLHSICGIPTAFKASYQSKKPGPRIAFLCEYDALEGIGHGCGHNLISAMSFGAALGVKSVIDEVGGEIVVFGTPAEETSGAKVVMAKEGVFDDVLCAMMLHPDGVSQASGASLALDALRFRFHGRTAHASAAPEKGINALDSVILLFNAINAMRQHVTDDVRIHGIISAGGLRPNIVPDFAEAKFNVRANKRDNLYGVVERIKKCAQAAAQMTGATVEIDYYEYSNDDMNTNPVLGELMTKNFKEMGETGILPASLMKGSMDMGNVSYHTAAAHGFIGLGNPELVLHTKEVADCTVSEKGREAARRGACILALTAFDVLIDPGIQEKIRQTAPKHR